MKKILVMIITATIICVMMPVVAKAATANNNTTFNLGTLASGEKLTIPSGVTVTLTGTAPTNAYVECGAGVDLTLDNARLTCTTDRYCALSFTGTNNMLNLKGSSQMESGSREPGVRVSETAELTINGTGELRSTGGLGAPGIGGGELSCAGTVTILGGNITAIGGQQGAGIGNSLRSSSGGVINILGGTVKAIGSYHAAGIGGSNFSPGCTTTISGGTVTASGGSYAAGIGGGNKGNGGTIAITGGVVAASGYSYDIGPGDGKSSGAFLVSGDAAILLRNNSCTTPTMTNHEKLGLSAVVYGKLYGVEAPSGWYSSGAIIIPCTLSYDANGATGSVPPSVTQHKNTAIRVADSSSLDNGLLTFKKWNTDSLGRAYGYSPGNDCVISSDSTLYAIWGDEDVTSVTLDQHGINLTQHDTSALVATIVPSDATKNNIVWHSDNTNVASVNQSGVVTAVGVGSATITAYADGKSDTCTVTVDKKAVTKVTLSATTTSIKLEDTLSLDATISPSDATYPDVTWTSSDSSVVTVDANGWVTAVGLGDATVQAEADGMLANCDVTVSKVGVTGITLSSNTLSLKLGESANIIASVEPSDATNPDVSWSTSDASVVTVSSGGAVTAVGTGSATITAKAGGRSATCEITVVLKAEKVTLNQNSAELAVGETCQLHGTVYPSRASKGVTTWESRDETIATVDTSGKVVAVGEGATSVVLTVDGASDACVIVVKSSEESGDKDDGKDNVEENATPEPKATSSPEKVVVEKTVFIINTEDLPYGAHSVVAPNGDIIPIKGDKVKIVLDGDADYNIVALDKDNVPIGEVSLETKSAKKGSVPVLVLLLGIMLGATVAGAVVYIVFKKRFK